MNPIDVIGWLGVVLVFVGLLMVIAAMLSTCRDNVSLEVLGAVVLYGLLGIVTGGAAIAAAAFFEAQEKQGAFMAECQAHEQHYECVAKWRRR